MTAKKNTLSRGSNKKNDWKEVVLVGRRIQKINTHFINLKMLTKQQNGCQQRNLKIRACDKQEAEHCQNGKKFYLPRDCHQP